MISGLAHFGANVANHHKGIPIMAKNGDPGENDDDDDVVGWWPNPWGPGGHQQWMMGWTTMANVHFGAKCFVAKGSEAAEGPRAMKKYFSEAHGWKSGG